VVVDAKCIVATVAMIPHRPIIPGEAVEDRFWLTEKPGLDVAVMGGIHDDLEYTE
jgi:hypothetical protein